MSIMSDLDLQLQEISEVMQEPSQSDPEVRLGMNIHQAFSALDEIIAMGASPETRHLVQQDLHMLGQIKGRLEWIGTFIECAKAAREQQGKLKMVVRNG